MLIEITKHDLEAMLQGTSDLYSECDQCHDEHALWIDYRTEQEGEFAYCRTCWERKLARMK